MLICGQLNSDVECTIPVCVLICSCGVMRFVFPLCSIELLIFMSNSCIVNRTPNIDVEYTSARMFVFHVGNAILFIPFFLAVPSVFGAIVACRDATDILAKNTGIVFFTYNSL